MKITKWTAPPHFQKLIGPAKERDAKRPPFTIGYQGRKDIPERITVDESYFYFYVRPCRPLEAGEQWEGRLVPRLFIGAALRQYVDYDGMPIREVIARCDKSRVERLYNNQLPWLRVELRDFHIPQSLHPWIGNPNVDHTFALIHALAHNGSDINFRFKLQTVRQDIETTTGAIERMKGSIHEATYRHTLELKKAEEAELVERLKLERSLSFDDDCDKWG